MIVAEKGILLFFTVNDTVTISRRLNPLGIPLSSTG